MLTFIWPGLILIGVLLALQHGNGTGLNWPGFLVVAAGVIGGLFAVARKPRTGMNPMPLLISVWAIAFLSIAKIYFGYFPDVFRLLPWVLSAGGFTIAGWILLVFYLLRKK